MFTVELVRGVTPKAAQSFKKNKVTFGRGDEVDYQFSNSETTVSRGIHFTLEAKSDDSGAPLYLLLNKKDNEISVQSEGGKSEIINKGESRELARDSTVQVGKDGPILSFQFESEAGATVQKRREKHSYGSIPEKDVVAAQTNRRIVVPIIAAIVVLTIVWNLLQEREDSDQAIRIAKTESAVGEMRNFRDNLADLKTAIESTQAEAVTTKSLAEKLERQADPSILTTKYAESIYVMGVMDALGKFQLSGTGWKVSKRKIYTNAHVAEQMNSYYEAGIENNISVTKVALLPGLAGEAGTRKVIELENNPRMHKGYEKYGGFSFPVLSLQTGLLNSLKPIEFLNGCDAAEFSSVADLPGESIPVAPMETLLKIKNGDRISTMGFPAIAANNENPSVIHDSGYVTSLTDTFNRKVNAERSVKLGISLNISGGASGSPIFNVDGHAIGIVTSGVTDNGDKYSWGDRADWIHDLLKNDYDNAFNDYEKYLWEFRNANVDIEAMSDYVMTLLYKQHQVDVSEWPSSAKKLFTEGKGEVESKVVTISRGDDRLIEVLRDVDVNGYCGIVAIANDGFDLDMEVQFEYPVVFNSVGEMVGPKESRVVFPNGSVPQDLWKISTPHVQGWIPSKNSIYLVNPWKNYSTHWYHDGQKNSDEMKVLVVVAEFGAVVDDSVGPVLD